jgi:sporulation protein YlmC with PRC-barrel domain
MMISSHNAASLIGATVTDLDGDKVGTVKQLFVDPRTGQPNWATVATGLFGTAESFVPLDEAEVSGGDIHIPYSKDVVKDAPRVESHESLEEGDEDRLYAYYTRDEPDESDESESAEYAVDSAGTVTGGARLRKYVVTEEQTITVPVSHEEVRLEPDGDADAEVTGEHRGRHVDKGADR